MPRAFFEAKKASFRPDMSHMTESELRRLIAKLRGLLSGLRERISDLSGLIFGQRGLVLGLGELNFGPQELITEMISRFRGVTLDLRSETWI